MHKSKIPYEIKLRIVEDYLAGKIGLLQKKELGVNEDTIYRRVAKYKSFGSVGLMDTKINNSHNCDTFKLYIWNMNQE